MSGSKTFVRQVTAILAKDLKTEWRTREIFTTTSVFTILVVLIFHFAIGANPALIRQVASGVLWVALLFATVLGLQRAVQMESGEDCFQGLLLAVSDRSAVFVAKMLANLLYLLIVAGCTLPLFSIWLHLDILKQVGALSLVLVLGVFGLSVVGTLFSLIVANIRMREAMLPLLLLPVSVPLTIAAVYATANLMTGQGLADIRDYLTMLGVFDVIFLALSIIIFDHIVEE